VLRSSAGCPAGVLEIMQQGKDFNSPEERKNTRKGKSGNIKCVSPHAAPWKSMFSEVLEQRAAHGGNLPFSARRCSPSDVGVFLFFLFFLFFPFWVFWTQKHSQPPPVHEHCAALLPLPPPPPPHQRRRTPTRRSRSADSFGFTPTV